MPFLFAIGLERIRPIHRSWKVKRAGGKITAAFPDAKVDGDLSAVIPPYGRSVLVEVKSRERRLTYSDFEPHQIAAMTDHIKHGGVALVVWWNDDGLRIMRWPVTGLAPGKGIDDKDAAGQDLQRNSDLRAMMMAHPATNRINPQGEANG